MLQELVNRSDILAEPGDWAICYLTVKISQHSRDRIVGNLQAQSKNLLRTTTLANNANGKVEAHIHRQEETMNEGILNSKGWAPHASLSRYALCNWRR